LIGFTHGLLLEDLVTLFADPDLPVTRAEETRMHGGRIEQRHLRVSTALVGYTDWPGLAQALCVERRVIQKRTGETACERAYAITSLATQRATAAQLLVLWREHWHIEIVQSQMTKPGMLAAWAGGNDVADLDLLVGDNHAVDQQFDELPPLRERRVG